MSGIIWSYFLDKLAIVPDARELEIVSISIYSKKRQLFLLQCGLKS